VVYSNHCSYGVTKYCNCCFGRQNTIILPLISSVRVTARIPQRIATCSTLVTEQYLATALVQFLVTPALIGNALSAVYCYVKILNQSAKFQFFYSDSYIDNSVTNACFTLLQLVGKTNVYGTAPLAALLINR